MEDLFKQVVDDKSLGDSYKTLIEHPKWHKAAMTVLNEIFNSLPKIDKDFVKQFQSYGCDARIWELYLTACFQELDFSILRERDRPDFELLRGNTKVFVEAVTSNPSTEDLVEDKLTIYKRLQESGWQNWEEFVIALRAQSQMKMAGALFNKLRKRYWELPWVKGHPLILAVEPFHHSMAHTLSDSILTSYLYGFEITWHYDSNNILQIQTHRITEHTYNGKTIPSNFFNLENSENISAVIFSNSGTISKFNRIGTLKGYGDKDVKLIRTGVMRDHNPNAAHALPFTYTVGEDGPNESWCQGLGMYHNPNAKYPLDPRIFPDMLHGYFDKEYTCVTPDFFPYRSDTHVIVPKEGKKRK
jgi:hypothetical protein